MSTNAATKITKTEAHAPNTTGEPKCAWYGSDVYSVSFDDIEVLIDRQTSDEVEIRVWRNGKYEEYPYAKMTFQADWFVCSDCTRTDVESAECDKCELCINCCDHGEGNNDLAGKVNLEQVYESLEAAIDVICDVDMRNAISAEYRKQIQLRYEADEKAIAPFDNALSNAGDHHFSRSKSPPS